ncbi:MAG: hypothetical protein DRN03_01320 [Thermoplasmata archaeon]|nr:MAG: hypothetical protein DRN03_01320 [Thermoplasmata archaeon]RLI18322.1 MAG: hypothetical protein DRO49_02385 [Candidatus Bathyarchaeota archaeon]
MKEKGEKEEKEVFIGFLFFPERSSWTFIHNLAVAHGFRMYVDSIRQTALLREMFLLWRKVDDE